MSRIAVTGHVNLAPGSESLIYQAIVDALARDAGATMTGVTCLAPGADSIFAQAVLDLGGRLEVIVPARDYRRTQVGAADAEQFDTLIARASDVEVMPFDVSGHEAYEAANHALVSRADRVIAVWNGQPDIGRGNTASVVLYARSAGKRVDVLWPAGVARATDPSRDPA